MDAIKCEIGAKSGQDFTQWRDELINSLEIGPEFGLSDGTIEDLKSRVNNFLQAKVCSDTPREDLVKQLWAIDQPDERKAIASQVFMPAYSPVSCDMVQGPSSVRHQSAVC